MRRSGSSASGGHSSIAAGHHAWASCSWSGVTSAPVGQPRLADEHHQPVRQAHERLDLDALGGDRPLLVAARA